MMKRMILLIAVLALVATACGGSWDGDSSGVASLSTIDSGADDSAAGVNSEDPVDPEQALLDLTQCIRDQDIDIADPTVDADGNPRLSRPEFGEDGPPEGFREAIQACSAFLEGVTLGRQGQDRAALEETLVEYTTCMRENGYLDIDDPDFSSFGQPGEGGGPGAGGGIFGDIDREDPDFISANAACEDLLAGFGPGGGGGIGGGRPPGGDGA